MLCSILILLMISGLMVMLWLKLRLEVFIDVLELLRMCIWLLFRLWMLGWLVLGLKLVVVMLVRFCRVLLRLVVWVSMSWLLLSELLGWVSMVLFSGLLVMMILLRDLVGVGLVWMVGMIKDR